jgi:hypothetical protein
VSDLTDRIDDAFTRPDFQDAIRLVKAAMQDELKILDAGLKVEETRYFNHAIYPDLVLGWYERGDHHQRPLFLRFEVAEGTVSQDLRLHAEKSPVFVGLLDHRDEVPDAAQETEAGEVHEDVAEPAAGGALLAEASAIDLLEGFARERPHQMVATSALMRGGRGRLSEGGAEQLGSALGAGFDAASEGRDPELVVAAFEHIEELVSPSQADQLATHLQLLWVSSGGELSDLFGEGRLQVEGLSDLQLRELLEYLLTRERRPSTATLRRFSSALDPDRLGRLLPNFDGVHLGALIDANLSHWTAKWVQVLEGGPVGWRLDDELLRFGLGDVQLTFTSRGKKLSRFHAGQAVARSEFTARLGDDDTISLDMVSDEAELALRRRPGADADVQLRPEQIEALGELARYVLRGTIISRKVSAPGAGGDGTEVGIDFSRGVVAFAHEVNLSRAQAFTQRYFGLQGSAPE